MVDGLEKRLRSEPKHDQASRIVLEAAIEQIGAIWGVVAYRGFDETAPVTLLQSLEGFRSGDLLSEQVGFVPSRELWPALKVSEAASSDPQQEELWFSLTDSDSRTWAVHWRRIGSPTQTLGWLGLAFPAPLPATSQQALREIALVLSELLIERLLSARAQQLAQLVTDQTQVALWLERQTQLESNELLSAAARLVAQRLPAERVWIAECQRGSMPTILGVSDSLDWDSKSDWARQIVAAAKNAIEHGGIEDSAMDSSRSSSQRSLRVEWYSINDVLPTRKITAAIDAPSSSTRGENKQAATWIWIVENEAQQSESLRHYRASLLTQARQGVESEQLRRRSQLLNQWFSLSSVGKRLQRRWLIALLLLTTIIVGLLPVPLRVVATGELQPERQRHIFAPDDGRLEQLHVEENAQVDVGTTLAVLVNDQLRQELAEVEGAINNLNAEIDSIRSRLASINVLDADQAIQAQQLRSRSAILDSQRRGLLIKQQQLQQREAGLTITSPIAGEIMTRDLTRRLQSRPLQRGQTLMVIVDRSGPWQVRARIKVDELAPVLERMAATRSSSAADDSRLSVTVESAATGSEVWMGEQLHLGAATIFDAQAPQNAEVEVTTTLIETPSAELQPGTQVTIRIDCGRSPLGYVLFRRLIEGGERYGWW